MKIRVEHPEGKKIATPVLAEAIVEIGKAAKKLNESGLNERGVIALLHDATRMGKRDIEIVLGGLRQLEAWYCKK